VFLAIMAISFFWTIGAVLFIQFPPLAKNVLLASKEVASLFLVMFSVGVAIGSMSINACSRARSRRASPASVMAMGDVRRPVPPRVPALERGSRRPDERGVRFICQPLAAALLLRPCWASRL
jgi:hypothetical protein